MPALLRAGVKAGCMYSHAACQRGFGICKAVRFACPYSLPIAASNTLREQRLLGTAADRYSLLCARGFLRLLLSDMIGACLAHATSLSPPLHCRRHGEMYGSASIQHTRKPVSAVSNATTLARPTSDYDDLGSCSGTCTKGICIINVNKQGCCKEQPYGYYDGYDKYGHDDYKGKDDYYGKDSYGHDDYDKYGKDDYGKHDDYDKYGKKDTYAATKSVPAAINQNEDMLSCFTV